MLDETTLDRAREKLTLGRMVPDDAELVARYLGEYDSRSHLARALFLMDAPHVDLAAWPYCHIDWEEAAAALFLGGGGRNLLEIDGHWFDALATPPVVLAT